MGIAERMERERQLEDQQVVEVANLGTKVLGGMAVLGHLPAAEVDRNPIDYLRIQAIQDM